MGCRSSVAALLSCGPYHVLQVMKRTLGVYHHPLGLVVLAARTALLDRFLTPWDWDLSHGQSPFHPGMIDSAPWVYRSKTLSSTTTMGTTGKCFAIRFSLIWLESSMYPFTS